MQTDRFVAPLVLTLAAALSAQATIAPPQLAEQWGNACSLLPWNASTMRWQQLLEPAALPGTRPRIVLSLGWRRCSYGVYSATTLDHEVSLFDVPFAQAGMSTTFATNRAAGTGGIRFLRRMVNIPAMPLGNPQSSFALLPLDVPHAFAGPSLLVEAVSHGRTGTGWSVDMCYGSSTGATANFGTKCGPTANAISSNGTYLPGQTITIYESAGPPNAPAFNVIGFSAASAGGLPLPFDLAAINMPGCLLYTSLDLAQATFLNFTGVAKVLVAIPNDAALSGLSFSSQWVNSDATANPFGMSMSDACRITLGPIQCPMAHLYRLSDNADTMGTFSGNGGQVLRLHP